MTLGLPNQYACLSFYLYESEFNCSIEEREPAEEECEPADDSISSALRTLSQLFDHQYKQTAELFDLSEGKHSKYEVLVFPEKESNAFDIRYNKKFTQSDTKIYHTYQNLVHEIPIFDGSSGSASTKLLPVRIILGTLETDNRRRIEDHLSCLVPTEQSVHIYAFEIFSTRAGNPRQSDVIELTDNLKLSSKKLTQSRAIEVCFHTEENELSIEDSTLDIESE